MRLEVGDRVTLGSDIVTVSRISEEFDLIIVM